MAQRRHAGSAAAWMIAFFILPVTMLAVLPVGAAFSPLICPRGPTTPGVVGGSLRQRATARQPGNCACMPTAPRGYPVTAPVHTLARIAPVFARTALRAQRDDAEGAESFSDALVDFKGAPCLVTSVSEAEKAEILQLNRKTRKANFKDLQIVFPAHILKRQQHRASLYSTDIGADVLRISARGLSDHGSSSSWRISAPSLRWRQSVSTRSCSAGGARGPWHNSLKSSSKLPRRTSPPGLRGLSCSKGCTLQAILRPSLRTLQTRWQTNWRRCE